ncbi:MAG TPA: GNAT family N-acetyltransferase [Bacilli bacterium]|nr:GNAT family N-acetyltransferase [Bacilli bacterium]
MGIDKNKYNFVPYTKQEDVRLLVQQDNNIKRFLCSDLGKDANIIYYENNPIGFYTVTGYPNGELQLGIFEKYRGQGHGKELTIKITDDCFKDNYGSIILRTDKDNIVSQNSAQACGFMRDYDRELSYGDDNPNYIFFYKINYDYQRGR